MVEGAFALVARTELAVTLPEEVEEAEFENLGSTIEVVMEGKGGTLALEGVDYELLQFHFHHPSEHIDNGVSLPSTSCVRFPSATLPHKLTMMQWKCTWFSRVPNNSWQ